jgi:hypothetical protein
VFVYDNDFSSYSRIYENVRTNLNLPYTYTVDWSARTVTLNRALSDTQVLMVEVYEAGNALELARGNSDTIPLRTDELSGHTMIVLENGFKTLPIDPLIFVSGVKLEYNVDYSILPYNDGTAYPRMKIQFNTLYDPSVDRIVYYIFDDSITPNNSTQYNYSYPETETFIGTTDSVDEDGITYTLSLSADGANPTHAFVELDGLRLIPTVDYSIAGNILTLTNPIDDSRTLAYTTFNDISRMYMSTTTKTAITSGNLSVTVPHPTVPNPMPDINYSDVNTTWVSLNGRLLEPSRYSYDSSNHLTITGVSNGDQVIVTARVDGGSPNPSGFKLLVNKSGETSVYRTNPQDRTWVMLDFDIKDDTFHVADVTKLVEVVKVTNTVVAIDPSLNLDNDNDIGFLLDLNISNVSHVEAYNISKGLALARADIELEKFKGVNGVGFYDANTEIGDAIQLTLYIGNILESNGERMLFTQLDPVANTITGIKRGIQNTVITTHTKYDYVYGLNPARKLNSAYYSEIWGSSNYTDLGDPLQISTTDAAIFLNSGNQ